MAEIGIHDAGPSDYERLRLENIRRNEEYLKHLGLGKPKPSTAAEKDAEMPSGSVRASRSKRPRARPMDNEPLGPTRRSRRLSADPGESPEEMLSLDDAGLVQIGARKSAATTISFDDTPETIDISTERSAITAPMLRELIASSNALHDAMLSDEAVIHCAYRMSYMSNRALLTRLNQISKHATAKTGEKLLVFYYGLLASGMDELAELAASRLARIGVEGFELPKEAQ